MYLGVHRIVWEVWMSNGENVSTIYVAITDEDRVTRCGDIFEALSIEEDILEVFIITKRKDGAVTYHSSGVGITEAILLSERFKHNVFAGVYGSEEDVR